MSIGSRLRDARKDAGLTQTELAIKAGMKQNSISDLERGSAAGSTNIAALASVLGVNALWLETGRGPKRIVADDVSQNESGVTAAESRIQRLLALFLECDEKGRRLIEIAAEEAASMRQAGTHDQVAHQS